MSEHVGGVVAPLEGDQPGMSRRRVGLADAVRIGEAYQASQMPPPDPERNFEFGLQLMLDGVARYIDRKKAHADK